jgi:hypothetical protein
MQLRICLCGAVHIHGFWLRCFSWSRPARPAPAQDAPQWIEFDLGTPTDVELIKLLVDQAPAGLTVHEIYAGAHEDPGRFITTIEGVTEYGDRLEAAIGITVRCIRILTTSSPSWVAWTEIEVVPTG